MIDQFASDVLNGLNSSPKVLSSKYFYDKTGDELFRQIMELDEYYLTRTEYQILDSYKQQLLDLFSSESKPFNLVEFGAGDGYKTKVLLKHFINQNAQFDYRPIDISGNVLRILEESLKTELPELNVHGIKNEYFKALKQLENTGLRNVVLFLGSNIGNFTADGATTFLRELYDSLNPEDIVLIGFDLKKNPQAILNAYNDTDRVTEAFNFNLLNRINHELEGNFDTSKFLHFPTYNPLTGTTTSYLVSTENQVVEIMDSAIQFEAWEAIHMEISQKYAESDIKNLCHNSGFKQIKNFYDDKHYFTNSVWKK